MRRTSGIASNVIAMLGQSPDPVGAGALHEGLSLAGIEVSQAALARLLARLDEQGFTVKVGNQGRVLTDVGRRALEAERARQEATQWSEQALMTMGQSTMLDLRQSMAARRAIEREIARLAARHASAAQVAELGRIVQAQAAAIAAGGGGADEAVDFHRALAQVCGNRFLASAADLVRSTSEALERLMYQLGATIGSSCSSHMDVLEAIAARDPDAAERAMLAHMDELIANIDAWLAQIDEVPALMREG